MSVKAGQAHREGFAQAPVATMFWSSTARAALRRGHATHKHPRPPRRTRGLQREGLRGYDQALRAQHRLDRSRPRPDIHDGLLGPFPATGRQFALPLCEMWHFDASGLVVGGDLYYDQVSLLTQLRLLPQ